MHEAPASSSEAERLIAAGRFSEAAATLQSRCTRQPGDARAWFLLGACQHQMGTLGPALEAFERVLTLEPGNQQAALAEIAVLCQSGRIETALARGKTWLDRHPDDAQMCFSVGLICEAMADHTGALAHYDRTLALAPSHPGALQNRGIVLVRLGRAEDAVENNRRFVAACPQSLEAHYNLAESCLAARRYDETVRAAEGALSLAPGHPPALLDRGYALAALGRIAEARRDLGAALAGDDGTLRARFASWASAAGFTDPLDLQSLLQPEDLFLFAGYERVVRCDWTEYEAYVAHCIELIDSAPAESLQSRGLTYPMLNLPIPAAAQRKLAERVARGVEKHAASLPRPAPAARPQRTRLRIGYLSSDFRTHPTSFLTLQIYGLHDRRRFEVFGYSLSADDGSANFQTIKQSCDKFTYVHGLPAEEIARCIATDTIDILVDLTGYKRNGHSEVLALRPAPIQAGYVGYPATLGGSLLDYLIVDHSVIPPSAETFYAEKIARLPHCNLPTSLRHARALPTPARQTAGLPEKGVVFCAFFRHEKIDPRVFAIWMRILGRVPGSVLWLQSGPGEFNLRRHAEAAGIAPQRLVFAAPLTEWDAYLVRLRLADIYLDTLHFNTHTQGAEALWSDVPLITCPGEHWVSRVGVSLLRAIGLDELIVENLDQYEALAIELATHPGKLRELKAKLARNRDTYPLFDIERSVRNLDAVYLEMSRLHESGAGPRSFDVQEPPLS